MFEYFPDNYPWSLTTATLFDEAGTTSEPEEALRTLRAVAGGDKAIANEQWYQAMTRLGERVERLGEEDAANGHPLTAGRKLYRAALYYLRAERFVPHGDARQTMIYRRGTDLYRRAMEMQRRPVSFLDVPFEGSSLPALFVPARGEGPWPCAIFIQGFDSLKEWYYPLVGEEFSRRGVAMLIVDQPGAGGALRLNGLPATPDTERSVGACVDYLESRDDVDRKRIGVIGISLGGYYAPRAAAFEKRLAACAAWGAIWDFGYLFDTLFSRTGYAESIPDMVRHAMWVFGKPTPEEAADVARAMTLEGIAENITCPLLVMHGENDRQVPLWTAEKTYEAATNSARRELKIFRLADGGAEHCQVDNRSYGADCAADWFAGVLGGDAAGIAGEAS